MQMPSRICTCAEPVHIRPIRSTRSSPSSFLLISEAFRARAPEYSSLTVHHALLLSFHITVCVSRSGRLIFSSLSFLFFYSPTVNETDLGTCFQLNLSETDAVNFSFP